MNNDPFATHFDGHDPFAPEHIDEQISVRIAGQAPADRETQITQGLATLNKLPPGADDSLTRVRMRLRAVPFPIQTTIPAIEVNKPVNEFQTEPSRWPPSFQMETPPRGPSRVRRIIQTVAAVTVIVLVVGGFIALTQQHAGFGGHPNPPTAGTATSTVHATATSTATAPVASAAQVAACGFQASQTAYDLGNGLIAAPSTGQSYPAFQLPEGTPLKPFKVSANPSSQFPDSPLVNPNLSDGSGLALAVCNIGQQQATIQGVRMQIESFTPYNGQLNSWYPCDGMYSGPNTAGGGGCGGGGAYDEAVHASFTPSDGVGTVVNAQQKNGPMPFTLPVRNTASGISGLTLIKIGVTPPNAPGTYSFGLGLVTQQSETAFFLASKPMLLAPVAHKWDGQACLAPNMASQIPAETNPPTYYICPES